MRKDWQNSGKVVTPPTQVSIVKVGEGKREMLLAETVDGMIMGVSFTNEKLGNDVSRMVTFAPDKSTEESHSKQVTKRTKWILQKGGGMDTSNGTGIEITKGQQIKVNGLQMLEQITKFAEKSGIEGLHLRLKRKISEKAYQKGRESTKFKLKIYAQAGEFPKKGTTVKTVEEMDLIMEEATPIRELLNSSWFANIHYNLIPQRTISIELTMRDPNNPATHLIFF